MVKVLNSQVRQSDPLTLALSGAEALTLTELYYFFGLLRDDLWNFVTCTGITGSAADNQPLGYLTEAYRQQVTLNLPLREVVRIDKAFTCAKVVYVVENSGVYSALLDLCRDFCEEQGLINSN